LHATASFASPEATTETVNPTSVASETPGFAKLIIGQLASRGLLPPGK